MNSRAQSESIGVILLVAVVVITVSTVGAFVLSDIGEASETEADISVRVTTNGFYFVHGGGDPLQMDQLLIVVRDGNRTLRPDFTANTVYDGDDDAVFEPGERWANVNLEFDLETPVTVSLFDKRTNSLVVKDTRYPDRFFAGGPTAPVARSIIDPSPAYASDPSTFNASASTDPDGEIVSYKWYFGEGTTATGETVSHTYASNGTYNVTLQLVDDVGVITNHTRTVSVLPVEPQVVDVEVSNAPINQSDTTQNQTITVRFDRPMDTSVEPTVALENLTGTVSYGNGTWVNNSTFRQELNISDADEESIGRVNITDATDETGDTMNPDNSTTVVVDTLVPEISQFSVTNPSGDTIAVNFTSTEQLDEVLVTLEDNQDTVVKRFTKEDFTINETESGNYTYNGTYLARQSTTYNGTLQIAEDAVNNDGAAGQTDTVKITGGGSSKPIVRNFSDLTASIGGDYVNVGNVTVEDTEASEDVDSVTLEVREVGNSTLLGSTTIQGGTDVVSENDVRISAPIDGNTTYNVTLIANDTKGNTVTEPKNVTSEYTDITPPVIEEYGEVTYNPSADEVTVRSINVSDDTELDRVEFAVNDSGGTIATKTVSVDSTNENLTSVVISTNVKNNEQYNVTATVYDAAGNTVSQTKQAVESSKPTIKNFSDLLASSNGDYVTVGNVTVEDPGLDSVTVEVRQNGNLLNSTTFRGGKNTKRIAEEDVRINATIDNGETYDVVVVGEDTNGNSYSETRSVDGEETDITDPTIDAFPKNNTTANATTDEVTVGTLNVSDDTEVDKVEISVYKVKKNQDGLLNSTVIDVDARTAALGPMTLKYTSDQGIKSGDDYRVEVTVSDGAGHTATVNRTVTATD